MYLPFIGVKEGGAEDVLVSEMRSWQWWLEHLERDSYPCHSETSRLVQGIVMIT